jgi:hypothetical protein
MPVFHLHGVRWIQDVAVSGVVRWDRISGDLRAAVRLGGTGTPGSRLTLTWNTWRPMGLARATGTVGGRTVSLAIPAP